MRAAGFELDVIQREQNAVFVVRRVEADYFLPATLGNLLTVTARAPPEVGASRMVIRQRVTRQGASGEELLFAATVTVAFIAADLSGPLRMPKAMRDTLKAMMPNTSRETGTQMKPTADLSFIHLITGASVPVQAVMLLLVLLSLWSWWLIFYKGRRAQARRKANASFDDSFWQGSDLNQLYARIAEGRESSARRRMSSLPGSVSSSSKKRQATASKEAVVDGTRRALKAATQREMDGLEHQLPGLATVASVSPYIGLLGTVWGIMNSFRGLASVGQATLAQVAPGIAEALIATAIGLFAAIPAVVAYNRFQAQLDRINTQPFGPLRKSF